MNLKMGSQSFQDVDVPLLWGTRAVIQDQAGRLSVIDLAGNKAKLEVLGDEPAPGIEFTPTVDGFVVYSSGKPIYSYNPDEKSLHGIELQLPDCQIRPWEIRVGTNVFSGNTFVGFGVGIAVTEQSMALGAPLPRGLARLVV